jgi:hypothetical protein
MYSNAVARDYSGGPPVSPCPPLFGRRSHAARVCTTHECHDRAAAGHALPPDCRTAPPPPRLDTAWHCSQPVPHPRRVAYKGCPIAIASPPFISTLVLQQSITASSLSSASCLRRPTGLPLPHRLHTAVPLFFPPSVSSTTPPSSDPFGPHLTSLSSPPAAGLIDALPGHRSSAVALERRRAGPFSPPHCCWLSSVRTPPHHLARRNRRRSRLESPPGALHLHRR